MLRKIVIHKALYKPVLFVGCERLPFTAVAALGGIILMANTNFYSIIGVLLFYLCSLIYIRRINEIDCQFFRCLYRYMLRHQDYYLANAFYPGKLYKNFEQKD